MGIPSHVSARDRARARQEILTSTLGHVFVRRLGVVFPKQYEQFEAYAYHHGADGEPDTEDDLRLGLVEATWNLEEYSATFQDDDIKFVGTIDQEGFFSPADDGPNPERRNNANNIGDVWVVAEYVAEGQSEPLRARAHLLVTVPLYMQWNQTGQR